MNPLGTTPHPISILSSLEEPLGVEDEIYDEGLITERVGGGSLPACRTWYVDLRGQRRSKDRTAYLIINQYINLGPVAYEVSLQQGRAQGQPT